MKQVRDRVSGILIRHEVSVMTELSCVMSPSVPVMDCQTLLWNPYLSLIRKAWLACVWFGILDDGVKAPNSKLRGMNPSLSPKARWSF